MFGMTFLAGLMQLAIAPLLRRLRVLLPPEIAGLVIAIIGLSLAIFGVRYSLGSERMAASIRTRSRSPALP